MPCCANSIIVFKHFPFLHSPLSFCAFQMVKQLTSQALAVSKLRLHRNTQLFFFFLLYILIFHAFVVSFGS